MKKKFLSIVLVLCILVALAPCVGATTIVDSGQCGDNATYTLDSDGTLTISGKGDISETAWDERKSEIMKVIINNGITSVGFAKFAECTHIREVIISDSVTEIGSYAFYRCPNLQKMTLSENLKKIGGWTFASCHSLNNIKIPTSVNSIGEKAFSYSGTSLIVNNGSYAQQYAIENDLNYGYWSAQNGTLTIGGNNGMDTIFDTYTNSASGSRGHAPWKNYAEDVTNVVIDEGITDVGGYAFDKFINIKNVSIPSTVTEIQEKAFNRCVELENVTIPSSCTKLDSTAFDYCSSLKSITIPASVISIDHASSFFGRTIFAKCSAMELINVDSNNANYCSVDGVLFTKDTKILLKYPDGKKGEVYEIPYGVTNIGNQAFLYSNYLSKLIVPKTIEEIDYYALSTLPNGTNLTEIYYKGSKEEWESMSEIYMPNITVYYNAIGTNPPKMSGTPTISNNKLNINLSDVEYDSSLITVFSDGNKIISSAVTPISASDTTKSVVLPNNGENQAKVFIWDSLEGMRPLCEAETVTVK